MDHIETHPHALIDINGYVKQVLIFSEHDQELLQNIKNDSPLIYGEELDIICCCDNGVAQIGWKWENNQWIEPPEKYAIISEPN